MPVFRLIKPLLFAARHLLTRLTSASRMGEHHAPPMLAHHAEPFRSLIEHALDIITILDVSGTVRYESPAIERVLGYSQHALVGCNIFDFVHPADRTRTRREFVRGLAIPAYTVTLEVRFLHADGSWRIMAVTGRNLLFDPTIAGVVLNARDVTEHKVAEEALRHQHAYEAALHETTLALMNRLELDDVLETIVTRASTLIGCEHGYIYLVDRSDSDHLVLHIGTGVFEASIGWRLKRDEGLSGKVWATGQPVVVEHYSTWSERAAGFAQHNLGVLVGVPLTSGGVVVGVLGVGQTEAGRGLTTAQVEVLSRFAQLASIALDNARLYTAAQHELKERHEVECALRHSEERFRLMIEGSEQVFFYMHDLQHRFEYVSPSVQAVLGFSAEELLGQPYEMLLSDDPHNDAVAVYTTGALTTGQRSAPYMAQVRHKQGALLFVEIVETPVVRDGMIVGLQGFARDITQRQRAELARARGEAQFRAIFEESAIGIALIDAQARVLACNPALQRMLGYAPAELDGRTFAAMSHPDDHTISPDIVHGLSTGQIERSQFEQRFLCNDGRVIWTNLTISCMPAAEDGSPLLLAIMEDVTERKASEDMIKRMAYYDVLTALPNRVLFQDRLRQAIVRARRSNGLVALLFLDLDRFKVINDTLGHHTGDLLLQAAASRLAGCVRDGDTVARMGGDEFTIILPEIEGTSDAVDVAQRIIAALNGSFTVNGQELVVTTSIGISVFPGDGSDPETLLKHADTAMYRAKESARNTYQFYDPAMNQIAYKQLELEQHLRHALERGEFELYYQPRVNTTTTQIDCLEALLRWRHPELGLVMPGEFIPVAEDTGLIVPLGEWVLRAACAQNKAWQQRGFAPVRVAVNLSARQFQQPDLADVVALVLHETGLAPQYLELEITESMTMLQADRTLLVLGALKAMGVQLAMDDFGTGYSSLSYLKQFPIDTLKIDKSFVRDITRGADDAAIAQAMIALAHSLNLTVTAEGVETEDQLAFLRRHHCDEVQGYLIARPVPAATVEQLLHGIPDGAECMPLLDTPVA